MVSEDAWATYENEDEQDEAAKKEFEEKKQANEEIQTLLDNKKRNIIRTLIQKLSYTNQNDYEMALSAS